MAFVRVEQRNAHLAAPVRLDYVKGRDGQIAKATLTAISNSRAGRRGSARKRPPRSSGPCGASRPRTPPSTSARAATSTSSAGCRTTTTRRAGRDVYGLTFTCEEIDYLDSQAEAEARRQQRQRARARATARASARAGARRRPQAADGDDDVPF